MISLSDIYSPFINLKWDLNKLERYGKEVYHLFHASSAGLCIRKHWFMTNPDVPETDPPDEKSERVLRLGTLVHDDYEKAIAHFLKEKERNKEKENNNNIYIYNNSELLRTIKTISTEVEVTLPELNVRGHYDIVIVMETGEVYLYDLKTIGSWGYTRKFGHTKNRDKNPSINNELQIATYGLAVQQEFGRLDGMYLHYYKKDDSIFKQKEVPLSFLQDAITYWKNVNDAVLFQDSPPPIANFKSPVYTWECGYCQYSTYCNNYN